MAKKPSPTPQTIYPSGRSQDQINRGDRGDSDRVEYGMVVTCLPRFSKRYYLVKQKTI